MTVIFTSCTVHFALLAEPLPDPPVLPVVPLPPVLPVVPVLPVLPDVPVEADADAEVEVEATGDEVPPALLDEPDPLEPQAVRARPAASTTAAADRREAVRMRVPR
ncbi:hypothetical protein [Streptacidiphilus sp. BW17]|uniref:hypothetical protein n=1 Tax=Streptacidiphilus sp. BW17 TaxID=3156274 RepID=UPI003518FF05